MGLLDLLGFNKLPTGVAGSTLVLADATTLARADALLVALQARFGNVAVAQLGSVDYRGSLPQIELSADNALERLKKIRPQRLIVLGLDGRYANLVQAADCPAWWVNAPLVMPEVITGMSLLLLMVFVQRMVGWPDRGFITIVVGHTLLGMAYATVVIQSRLSEVDRSIEEAAMDLGCGPMQVFFLVTLPTIAPALVSAWLLSFTLSFDDVVISEFLSGPGVTTLPQVIFGYARRGVNPSIYAAATLLIAVVSLGIVLYSIGMLRRQRRLGREVNAVARPAP